MYSIKNKNKFIIPQRPAGSVGLVYSNDWNFFDKFVEQCYYNLFEAAESILKSRYDAEDVVQQAVLKALRQFCKFRGEADYYTYLIRVVINESRNLMRRKRLSRKCQRIPQEERSIRDPRDVLESKIILQLIVDSINALSPGMRKVLYLRFVRNCSYREIAVELNCQPGTVKSRLARGKKLLQRRLLELQVIDPGWLSKQPEEKI